jgi:hypothetical protein
MQWGLANHWSELRIAEGSRDGLKGARAPLEPGVQGLHHVRNHYIGRAVPSY